jgi:hypothetical protein
MTGLFGSSFGVFVGLAGLLFGFAAFLTGQAIADTWRPAWQAVLSAFGLAVSVRFLDFALFGGSLLALPAFLVAWAWLAGVAWCAWRLTLAHNMVRQYPWLYEAAGPFSWRSRG